MPKNSLVCYNEIQLNLQLYKHKKIEIEIVVLKYRLKEFLLST